jgi:predicted O-methyltransferase YrrM
VSVIPQRYSHRTPRYIRDRTRQFFFERECPDAPWLTPASIGLLEGLLSPDDQGAEFGSGRSTLWFADRVAALTSVEHDGQWYEKVTAGLKDRGHGHVDYVLAPDDQPAEHGGMSSYARVALSFPDSALDFALVDGQHRDYVTHFIMPKLRPGGMLIIDNVQWYLPCESKAPASRTAALGPATDLWGAIGRELASWRTIWTSSGVDDTAIFIKPGKRGF